MDRNCPKTAKDLKNNEFCHSYWFCAKTCSGAATQVFDRFLI